MSVEDCLGSASKSTMGVCFEVPILEIRRSSLAGFPSALIRVVLSSGCCAAL